MPLLELPAAFDDDLVWAVLDEALPTYFTALGEQREWASDGPMPTDWKLVCPHIDDSFINYGDPLRGLISWYLNRVTTEHLNTGRGWEPVQALIFFVRFYPLHYSPEQLAAIAVGYERRRQVMKRERRLSAPPTNKKRVSRRRRR